MGTKIRAQIGTSSDYGVVHCDLATPEQDVTSALELEHQEEQPDCCDICAARDAGFPFSAAHLLLNATETPLLDAVTKYHHDAMYDENGDPADWKEWTEHFLQTRRECIKCNCWVSRDSVTCGNCLQTLVPVTTGDVAVPKNSDVEKMHCLKLNVPHWFRRGDFMEWLNTRRRSENDPVATWHRGGKPNEYSDVFFTFDHDEGSEFNLLPEEYWEEIMRIAKERQVEWAVIWLTNLQS